MTVKIVVVTLGNFDASGVITPSSLKSLPAQIASAENQRAEKNRAVPERTRQIGSARRAG
jgi:hypothetical protein